MATIRKGNVIVITGASTGIGRAAALEFARRFGQGGPRLVLAARQIDKLEDVARECRELGAECVPVSVDVTDAEAVLRLATLAITRWGRLDVWINNAGVGVVGSFTEVPLEEHQKVIQTNLIGYINGAYAALRVFKKQRHGILINNASVCSRLATPYLAAYNASKFGIRGLSHSLRQDLALDEFPDVHVCQLNPGIIDTPAFSHAGNYSGLPLNIQFPMTKPEEVARKMVSLVERPRREVFVGHLAGLGAFGYTLFPALTGLILVYGMKKLYFSQKQNNQTTDGNVQRPLAPETDVNQTSLH